MVSESLIDLCLIMGQEYSFKYLSTQLLLASSFLTVSAKLFEVVLQIFTSLDVTPSLFLCVMRKSVSPYVTLLLQSVSPPIVLAVMLLAVNAPL